MEAALKTYFGFSYFRPYQKEIIQQVMAGRDTLVVMATGSGKSICYQIPPLITGRTAVVISPLISLIQDQVMGLKQRGIKAEYLGSSQTNQSVYSEAERGYFELLYMTPEKAFLLPQRFWSNLLDTGVCLLAVDEAHCISEWGHDFRGVGIDFVDLDAARNIWCFDEYVMARLKRDWKEYKQLDKLRAFLPNIPIVGLTATATEKVQRDIILSLQMKDAYVALGSFDRQNLFYGVKSLNRSLGFVEELVGEISRQTAGAGSTIVYCTTVKETEQIFMSLKAAGVKVGMYHGQMGSRSREESHRAFTRDELRVMVATIAFGMGVDKPDIRCVIHYGCPKSVESYYQESGRCGRDGLHSVCWLYYSRSDFAKADFYCAGSQSGVHRMAIMESLMAAEKYCLSSTCRRRFLLEYFGEKVDFSNCGNCDICTGSKTEKDLTRETFLLLTCVKACGGRWGLNMPIDVLRGSRSKKIRDSNFDQLPSHGMGKDYTSTWWKALGALLMFHGYLKESVHDTYRLVSVSPAGEKFLGAVNNGCQPPLVLALTSEMINDEGHEGMSGKIEGDLRNVAASGFEEFSEAELKLYQMLIDVRKTLAKCAGTAPYAICGDQTIRKIAKIRPSTKARLANIDGINQVIWRPYTEDVLSQLPLYCRGNEYLHVARVPLIHFCIVELHTPDRVLRQFGGIQGVPRASVTSSQLHAIDLRGKSNVDWTEFHAVYIRLWNIRRDYVVSMTPISLGGPDTIAEYMPWYRRITRRFIGRHGCTLDYAHIMHAYGDNIIQTISHLSQELNLSLDGKARIETTITKNVHTTPQRKLTSAKLDAWKMWQEDGLSLQEIAKYPGRAAPIKESTVLTYILEAAQDGCIVNWARLCDEIGLTTDIISGITFAVKSIGSRDRLKPIKEELPEHVTYEHIKTYLVMQDHGSLGIENLQKCSNFSEENCSPGMSGSPSFDDNVPLMQKREKNVGNKVDIEGKTHTGEGVKRINPPWLAPSNVDGLVLSKHQETECLHACESPLKKICAVAESGNDANPSVMVATEAAILDLLTKRDGITVENIIDHFKGSTEDTVVDILHSLESEFVIFRKSDLYRVM